MSSALFLAIWRAAKSQSVRRYLNNIKLHGNSERGAHKHYLCALLRSFLALLWVSDCGTEFLIAQSFCWDCIARIVSISPLHLPPVQTHFIYLPCLIVRQGEHAWLPWCPGSGNVTGWQTGECGQTFVVSRQRPGRLSWSQGKLVSWETHCKLMVVLCGRHAGLYCALSHMCLTM